MEDDLNFEGKGKTTSTFKAKGRWPQLFRQMEDDPNFSLPQGENSNDAAATYHVFMYYMLTELQKII